MAPVRPNWRSGISPLDAVLPRDPVLHSLSLGLKPEREIEFVLADGTTITRSVSECTCEIQGRRATSPVVLGESEDEALLGAVTLETLGLALNPLNRTLQPMRMVLTRTTAVVGARPKS